MINDHVFASLRRCNQLRQLRLCFADVEMYRH